MMPAGSLIVSELGAVLMVGLNSILRTHASPLAAKYLDLLTVSITDEVLTVWVDGKVAASSPTMTKLTVQL
jgi:hypothetical protein|eukprot:COSAG06_NODE_1717_length_8595_cov_5.706097_3_plen_71_part_00